MSFIALHTLYPSNYPLHSIPRDVRALLQSSRKRSSPRLQSVSSCGPGSTKASIYYGVNTCSVVRDIFQDFPKDSETPRHTSGLASNQFTSNSTPRILLVTNKQRTVQHTYQTSIHQTHSYQQYPLTMNPSLQMARRVSFDPALLADDFEKWLTAFKWDGRKVSIVCSP